MDRFVEMIVDFLNSARSFRSWNSLDTVNVLHDLLLLLIIDIIRQMGKVLFCQDLIQMGSRIEHTDLLLSKAMALFAADITGVFALRTSIMHLKIVSRITGG